jgi:hypothetical protein
MQQLSLKITKSPLISFHASLGALYGPPRATKLSIRFATCWCSIHMYDNLSHSDLLTALHVYRTFLV